MKLMDQEEINKKIWEQLDDHEKRISVLEGTTSHRVARQGSVCEKQKTLREIIKGRKFKNGQQQIAVIVGYHERNIGTLINRGNIKLEWLNAKVTNQYSNKFIDRAKDVLIRVHSNGTCDLTQLGEEFFDDFLKNESVQTIPK